MRLKGKIVLITGTTRGIGKAAKELLTKKGCCVWDYNRHSLTLPDMVDVLVNNAGVFYSSPSRYTSQLDWASSFYTNVEMPFFLIQKLIREGRFNRSLAVVLNINSTDLGRHPVQQICYNCSKAALHELTLSLGKELFMDKILVTEIFLPTARTDMLKRLNPANPLPKKIISTKEAAKRIADLLRRI